MARLATPQIECNRLLLALPRAEYAALRPLLAQRHVVVEQVLYEPDRPIAFVYFPQSSVMAVTLGVTQRSLTVEVATIGREGFLGLPVFLNTDHDTTRTFVQVAGVVSRMRASVFRQLLKRGGRLPGLLQRYTQVAISHIVQAAACNQAHSIGQRCARWLLLTHDRVDGDQFDLKQEFLGHMLGVHRTGVSTAAGTLRQAKLIRYSRGRIQVRNRAGLESAACECYGIMVREYDRHLASAPRSRAWVS
jgi:CRP-like cAMP-binding protein